MVFSRQLPFHVAQHPLHHSLSLIVQYIGFLSVCMCVVSSLHPILAHSTIHGRQMPHLCLLVRHQIQCLDRCVCVSVIVAIDNCMHRINLHNMPFLYFHHLNFCGIHHPVHNSHKLISRHSHILFSFMVYYVKHGVTYVCTVVVARNSHHNGTNRL